MIKTQIVRALYLGKYSFWEALSRVKILKPNLKYFTNTSDFLKVVLFYAFTLCILYTSFSGSDVFFVTEYYESTHIFMLNTLVGTL